MKARLFAATIASLVFVTTANAATFTIGNLVITQISPENPTTFNDVPLGPTGFLENSAVCDFAYCGPIQLSSDGAVAVGTTGASNAPAGDPSRYLYGADALNPLGFIGAEIVFNPPNGEAGDPNSFNIYWGSIDALDTLTVFTIPSVNTQDSVTGAQLVTAGFGVNGVGDPSSPNDNQWFNVRDTAGPNSLLHCQLDEGRVRARHGVTCTGAVDLGVDVARFRRLGLRRVPPRRQGARPPVLSRAPTEALKAAYARPFFFVLRGIIVSWPRVGRPALSERQRCRRKPATDYPPRSHTWAWFRA